MNEQVVYGWILVLIYMATVLFFVVRGARKIKNISDYAVGNIAFSPVAVGLSLAASITSAATFIINPGFVAYYGMSAVLSFAIVLPLGIFPSLIIFTKGFRKYGSDIKAQTMAQWIGQRYKSPFYSLLFAFLSLLLITFIVLICVALTVVLSTTLEVDKLYVLVGIVVFIFGYMMFGGANSLVYTNTIQALIMLVVAFILLGSGYEHFREGVHGFLAKIKAIDKDLVTWTNPNSPLFRDFFEIIFCQLVVGIAIICQPHIITKSLLLKSEKDVNKYLVVGIFAETIFFLLVFVGLYSRISFPDLTFNGAPIRMDEALTTYVKSELPIFVSLLVVMGLISAGLSTLESLIQSLSTTITSDIVKPLFGRFFPKDEEKSSRLQIGINRIVIVGLAVISAYISYQQIVSPNLSVAILAQCGVYSYFAAAFVPVLFGTFFKEVPKVAPIMASITAVFVHFYLYLVGIAPGITPYMWETVWEGQRMVTVRNPAIPATAAILTSLVVGLILYYVPRFFQKPEKKTSEGAD